MALRSGCYNRAYFVIIFIVVVLRVFPFRLFPQTLTSESGPEVMSNRALHFFAFAATVPPAPVHPWIRQRPIFSAISRLFLLRTRFRKCCPPKSHGTFSISSNIHRKFGVDRALMSRLRALTRKSNKRFHFPWER